MVQSDTVIIALAVLTLIGSITTTIVAAVVVVMTRNTATTVVKAVDGQTTKLVDEVRTAARAVGVAAGAAGEQPTDIENGTETIMHIKSRHP